MSAAALTSRSTTAQPESTAAALRDASDAHLLERFRAEASEPAFATLVERHAGVVAGVCARRLGRTHPQFDDACQATFVLLARHARRVDGRTIAGWLHRAAGRVAGQVLRAEHRRRRRERVAATDWFGPASSTRIDDDLAQRLDGALARLSDAQREAVVRHFLQAKPQAEVARELGISEGAVKKRVADGIGLLRLLLSGRTAATIAAVLTAGLTEASAATIARGKLALGLPTGSAATALAGAAGAGAGVIAVPAIIAAVGAAACCAVAAVALVAGSDQAVPPPAEPAAHAGAAPAPIDLGWMRALLKQSWEERAADIEAIARGGGTISGKRLGMLTHDEVWLVRQKAIEALPLLHTDRAAVIAALETGFADPVWSVKEATLETLGELGPEYAELAPRARALLADPIYTMLARWTLDRLEPAVTPAEARAARVRKTVVALGAAAVPVDAPELGADVILLAGVGVDAGARRTAIAELAAIRQAWPGAARSAPFARPLTLVLARNQADQAALGAALGIASPTGYHDLSRTAVADLASSWPGRGSLADLWRMALCHAEAGGSARWRLPGDGWPEWLRLGLTAAEDVRPGRLPPPDRLLDVHLGAWLTVAAVRTDIDVPSWAFAAVPADLPTPRLATLVTVGVERDGTGFDAWHYALARALVLHLADRGELPAVIAAYSQPPNGPTARRIREWSRTPGLERARLEAAAGIALPDLERRLFAWFAARAGKPPTF